MADHRPHGTAGYPGLSHAGSGERTARPRPSAFLLATHGSVNGIDFWSEDETKGHGTIIHRGFDAVEGGDQARIVSHNDWLAPDGKRQCEDVRRITLLARGAGGISTSTLRSKPATDRSSLATPRRAASASGWLRACGPKTICRAGSLIAEGQTGDAAWGKRAAWVDYYGPVDGRTLGIAILNHPSSFRFPTYWHVRGYGLFAANVFGVHDFTGEGDGSYTLPAGESIRLRSRSSALRR